MSTSGGGVRAAEKLQANTDAKSPEGSTVEEGQRVFLPPSNYRRCAMGDKSPKSKERQKKQDAAHKDQQKAAAIAKAKPADKPLKGGK